MIMRQGSLFCFFIAAYVTTDVSIAFVLQKLSNQKNLVRKGHTIRSNSSTSAVALQSTFNKNESTTTSFNRQPNLSKGIHSSLAMGLLTASTFFQLSQQPAQALEETTTLPPKTALVIETTQTQPASETIRKTSIDGKALVKTLIANRKELNTSVRRIIDFTTGEIQNGPLLEIGKELLTIEGDVVPEVKVKLPTDVRGALVDLSVGKFDVVVNGEILYVDVQEVKGDKPGDDEITIRIRGTRASLPDITTSALMERDRVVGQSGNGVSSPVIRMDGGFDFWEFWNSPLPITSTILPEGNVATNGQTILAGSTVGIAAIYIVSYQYHLSLIAKEEAEAQAKKLKREAAAAAKKKKIEEEASQTVQVVEEKEKKPVENFKEGSEETVVEANDAKAEPESKVDEVVQETVQKSEDPFGESVQSKVETEQVKVPEIIGEAKEEEETTAEDSTNLDPVPLSAPVSDNKKTDVANKYQALSKTASVDNNATNESNEQKRGFFRRVFRRK